MRTSLPSTKDVVTKLQSIIRLEGMELRGKEETDADGAFHLLAEFCRCDLRKMYLELHLFAAASGRAACPLISDAQREIHTVVVTKKATTSIESVSPATATEATPKLREQAVADMESVARDLELTSDALHLSEGAVGLPFLSGPSPGFGYRFTPEGSTFLTDSSKLSGHGNSTQYVWADCGTCTVFLVVLIHFLM